MTVQCPPLAFSCSATSQGGQVSTAQHSTKAPVTPKLSSAQHDAVLHKDARLQSCQAVRLRSVSDTHIKYHTGLPAGNTQHTANASQHPSVINEDDLSCMPQSQQHLLHKVKAKCGIYYKGTSTAVIFKVNAPVPGIRNKTKQQTW